MPILKGLSPNEMARIKPCQGCRYLTMCGDNGSCAYIFYRGERRPCKFGAGCTVKDTQRPHRRHELSIKPRALSEPKPRGNRWDTETAARMLNEGYPITEISKAVGAHYDTVRKWLKAQGMLAKRPPMRASWDRDRAKALYEQGWRIRDIADELQVPFSTVSITKQRHNWQRKKTISDGQIGDGK